MKDLVEKGLKGASMCEGKELWEMSGKAGGAVALGPGRFEKELLRVGRWIHPVKKFVLEVTEERLGGWVENFKRMLAKGIKVPVPYGHSYDPRDNAGFVSEMRIEGDRLVGVLEIPREEDAERVGSVATDVSVSINPDFTDGEGEDFGEVVEHVAITNYPVVAGQENFVALGEDGGQVRFVRLVMDGPAGSGERDTEEGCETEAQAEAAEEEPTGGDTPEGETGEKRFEASLDEGRWEGEEREALVRRVRKLEEERVEHEVERYLLSGRISPAVEGHVRRLLTAGGERIQLSATGESVCPAEELRAILDAMPEGAWVPLSARGESARVLERREEEISTGKVKALAKENAQMLRKGGGSQKEE